MNKKIKKPIDVIPHRRDLADIIIRESYKIEQDGQPIFFYFFAAKSKSGLSAFLILAIAFFFGFSKASKEYHQQQVFTQNSVIEEIYYLNSQIL